MKTVKRIFIDDVVSLVKNFFALVIVVGICFLPALYAWFNIYSNWDPYGNTGALKFAAISLDKGFTDDAGEYHNQGDTIIQNLHENTAVDWQFVSTADEAINGVYSGEYYAAIVVDENFTYNMYNVLKEEVKRPTLHFYENQKKNPVATKISDTVVQSLQNNINVAFTEVVVSKVFTGASQVSTELQEQGGVDAIMDKLHTLSNDLTTYQNAITKIIENDAQLKKSLEAAEKDAANLQIQASNSAKAIKDSAKVSAQANTTLNEYSTDVNRAIDIVNAYVVEMNNSLDKAKASQDANVIAKELKNAAYYAAKAEELGCNVAVSLYDDKKENLENTWIPLLESIQAISGALGKDDPAIDQAINNAKDLGKTADELKKQGEEAGKRAEKIQAFDEQALVSKGTEQLHAMVDQSKVQALQVEDLIGTELTAKANENLSSLTGTLNNANTLLNTVGETFGNMQVMFSAIGNTVDCANTSLEKTNEAIAYVNGKLIKVLNDAEKAGSSEKIGIIVNALSGDPEMYGKFFSTPVQVKTKAVYPIENYGSAVAPFYSTLAFWVGALILTAIIRIKPDKSKYPKASERQLYFGRYVLYWVLGQIQAAIIVAGDIFLLHVQCLHPWLFLLAASVIATTFTILIYSLVTTWGDAGKALAVVLVVIQIAGSSGTYPIELLPDFFKKVYIFFPFPYAINAIRECLCGMYKFDYLKYLGCLVIFMGVSLVIGLLVRIPFESINHYMEERMEETEMM